MKLLRIGKKGHEIPAALDKNGKYRNLSSHIKDLNPDTINFENLESLSRDIWRLHCCSLMDYKKLW